MSCGLQLILGQHFVGKFHWIVFEFKRIEFFKEPTWFNLENTRPITKIMKKNYLIFEPIGAFFHFFVSTKNLKVIHWPLWSLTTCQGLTIGGMKDASIGHYKKHW